MRTKGQLFTTIVCSSSLPSFLSAAIGWDRIYSVVLLARCPCSAGGSKPTLSSLPIQIRTTLIVPCRLRID